MRWRSLSQYGRANKKRPRKTNYIRTNWLAIYTYQGSEYYKSKNETLQALDDRLKLMGFSSETVQDDKIVSDPVIDAIKQEATRLCSVYQREYNEVKQLKYSEETKLDSQEFDLETTTIKEPAVEVPNLFGTEEQLTDETYNFDDALSKRLKNQL